MGRSSAATYEREDRDHGQGSRARVGQIRGDTAPWNSMGSLIDTALPPAADVPPHGDRSNVRVRRGSLLLARTVLGFLALETSA
jgi:hypothetical protein